MEQKLKPGAGWFWARVTSNHELKQQHEIDILAQESPILEIWAEPIYTGSDCAAGRAPWANLV